MSNVAEIRRIKHVLSLPFRFEFYEKRLFRWENEVSSGALNSETRSKASANFPGAFARQHDGFTLSDANVPRLNCVVISGRIAIGTRICLNYSILDSDRVKRVSENSTG